MNKTATSRSRGAKATPLFQPHAPSWLKNSPQTDQISLLHTIVDNIGDELMLTATDGTILYVNESAVRAIGYPRSRLLRRNVIDLFQPKVSPKDWRTRYVARLKNGKGPLSFRVQRRIKGGVVQTIEVTGVYIRAQKTAYVLSIARDITRQLEMQRKLSESENLFRLFSEGAGDGIFTMDMHGKITYANRALGKLLQVPLSKFPRQPFSRFISRGSLPAAQQCFRRVRQGQPQLCQEIEFVDKFRHKIPVEVNAVPLYKDGKIQYIHAVIRDIRGRKHLEEILRRSGEMRAIQHVVTGTAQELRYPLLGLSRLTKDLLRRYQHRHFEYIGYGEFQDILRTVGTVNERIGYCCQTIERLMHLNRKRSGLPRKSCDPRQTIRDVLRLHEAQNRQNDVSFRCRFDRRLPPVAMDKIELTQIITNLLNNAEQSMPAGGNCSIRTVYHKGSRQAEIQIKDQGIGIPPEHLPHIFEPFFTTRQRGIDKNSGLGLPIAASLVRSHQGDIRITSSLRQGTTVTIRLPVVKRS